MNIRERLEKDKENILSNFDFDRVRKTMEALNWTYYEKGIPSTYLLIQTATHLIDNAIKYSMENSDRTTVMATGGFKVFIDPKDDYYMELSFVVTDWDNSI